MPPATSTTKVSFIVLGDPPATSSSFRPFNDEKMWWGRRDSLVRITALSLYQEHGVASPVCENLVMVFHKGGSSSSSSSSSSDGPSDGSSTDIAVMAMNSRLPPSIPIPTELNLISRWKDAAQRAERQPQKAALLGSSDSGCVCSFRPYIEAPGYIALSSSSSSSSSAMTSTTTTTNTTTTTHALDKRTMLKQLQALAPLDFLRRHRLNGPEELILKKASRGAVEAALHEWTNGAADFNSGPSSSSSSSLSSSATEAKGGNGEGLQDALVQTFQVVLQRCIDSLHPSPSPSTKSGPSSTRAVRRARVRTTCLLLHEDYPQELPVYGGRVRKSIISSSSSNGSSSSGSGSGLSCVDDDDDDDEGVVDHVICLLGAVRDATSQELAAFAAAVQLLTRGNTDLRLAGCNLGRTAEFTSKICASICLHALLGGLGTAVGRLDSVGTGQGQGLGKLAPGRAGGWTWDGWGNKANVAASASSAAAADSALGIASTADGESERPALHLHFALWLPFDATHLEALCTSSSKSSGSSSSSSSSSGASDRERLHDLIQHVVCALWRSRLGSENSEAATGASSSNSSGECSGTGSGLDVVPVVTLVLRNTESSGGPGRYRLVTLTQASVALHMAKQHQAAPAEWQVLGAILRVLRDSSSSDAGAVDAANVVASLVRLSAGENRLEGVSVLDLSDVTPVCRAGARLPTLSATKADSKSVDLWSYIYFHSQPFGTVRNAAREAGDTGGPSRILALIRGRTDTTVAAAGVGESDRPVDAMSSLSLRISRDQPCSAALAATMLLQWGHSGVLRRAVREAEAVTSLSEGRQHQHQQVEEDKEGIEGQGQGQGEEEEEVEARRERKRKRKEEKRARKAHKT